MKNLWVSGIVIFLLLVGFRSKAQTPFHPYILEDSTEAEILSLSTDTPILYAYSGYWGTNDSTLKHLIFYGHERMDGIEIYTSVMYHDNNGRALQQLVDFSFEGCGSYPENSGLSDVFTHDFDTNGIAELFIIAGGAIRCESEYERENPETGEYETVYTMATCDYYTCTILKENGETGLLEHSHFIDKVGEYYPDDLSIQERLKLILGE